MEPKQRKGEAEEAETEAEEAEEEVWRGLRDSILLGVKGTLPSQPFHHTHFHFLFLFLFLITIIIFYP